LTFVSDIYYNLNTSATITPTLSHLRLAGAIDRRDNIEKIKSARDYVRTFTFLDAGLSTERISTIVHSSTTLGDSITETFVWAGVSPNFYVSTITYS
jgi:hypothetical protein